MIGRALGFMWRAIFVRHEVDVYARNRAKYRARYDPNRPKHLTEMNLFELVAHTKRQKAVSKQRAEIAQLIRTGSSEDEIRSDVGYIWPENRAYFGL